MLTVRIALLAAVALLLAACGAALADSDDVTDDSSLPPTTTEAPTTTLPDDTTTTFSPDIDPEIVSVPDLSGMTLEEARALLSDAGLELEALPGDIAGALVMAQEPAPGDEVAVGTVIVVDVRRVATCNPPDPLAPGPGEEIITVMYECGGDATAPTAGVGVARIVPESANAADRIAAIMRSLLAGPTVDEQEVGIHSAFDSATAGSLNSVTLTDGALVLDFNDAIRVNNMSTSTGSVFFNAELRRNAFLHPDVDSVEFRLNGDCAAWSALFESDGCWVISRADWEAQLASGDGARDQ